MMRCPVCNSKEVKVIGVKGDGEKVYRKRFCPVCEFDFCTVEAFEDGATELYQNLLNQYHRERKLKRMIQRIKK